MTYHTTNTYNRWQKAISSIQNLDLPTAIFQNEKTFRQFATTGQIDSGQLPIISINDLTLEQIHQLWDFANHYFEMDMLGFDALNSKMQANSK